jgi:hypothetical protein
MKTKYFILLLGSVMGLATAAIGQTYINHTFNQPAQMIADPGQSVNFCPGDSVLLGGNPTATGGTAPFLYSWGPNVGLSSDTVANPMASPPGTQIYTVTVMDANNCLSTGAVTLTAMAAMADFTFVPNALVVAFTDQSTNATTWTWDFGDGGTSTLQNPSHTYAADGDYLVCLTINFGIACEAITCDTVSVTAVGVSNPFPHAQVNVYPNPASGSQMQFEVLGVGMTDPIRIELFDLTGKRVLEYAGDAGVPVHTVGRGDLAVGMYPYRVYAGDALIGTGKVTWR